MAYNACNYGQNLLLAATPQADLEALAPHLEWSEHTLREQIGAPSQPSKFAYFPISGLFSVVTMFDRDNKVEAGLIGRKASLAPGFR